MPIECLTGVEPLVARYDGYLLDIWGVVMDGTDPYPGAVEALAALQAAGKSVVLLSNAPRRARDVAHRLAGIGVSAELYTRIICSGEASRAALADRASSDLADLGTRYVYIGPEKDAHLLNGLDYRVVDTPDDADFVLNTGPYGDSDTVARFDDLLGRCRDRTLPMICTNPDQLVVRLDGTRVICAGAIARQYAAIGGRVHYFGKPHAAIYRACFAALKGMDRRRILAVGDTLETDISGAQKIGLDTALVIGGVLADTLDVAWGDMPTAAALERLCLERGIVPDLALPALVW